MQQWQVKAGNGCNIDSIIEHKVNQKKKNQNKKKKQPAAEHKLQKQPHKTWSFALQTLGYRY